MQVELLKTCSKCQEAKPLSAFNKERRSKDGVRSQCKKCISQSMSIYTAATKNKKSEYDKKYREKNLERLAKQGAEWRLKNKEKLTKYRADNKERRASGFAEWAGKNADYLKQKRLDRYAKNPEKYRKISANYRSLHPEKAAEWKANNKLAIRLHWHSRRARKINAGGNYSRQDIRNLLVFQKNRCACCRRSIKNIYHIDHVTPLFLGGSNDKTNIQLLCPTCNLSKGAKHPVEFMQEKGFLL